MGIDNSNGGPEEMNCIISLLVLSMTIAVGTASAFAEPRTVTTANEAIAIAKRLCAHFIPSDRVPSAWTAALDDGGRLGSKYLNSGWRVDVWYDDSRGNTMSLVDMYIFIPKAGKPSGCYALSN